MQQSGVGWWSCAVILCPIFVKGRLWKQIRQTRKLNTQALGSLTNRNTKVTLDFGGEITANSCVSAYSHITGLPWLKIKGFF